MSDDSLEILHIIEMLSLGGASRAMLTAAKYSSKINKIKHKVASLLPPNNPQALELATEYGVEVVHSSDPNIIKEEIKKADIVNLQWWNNPKMDSFLRSGLPECRLAAWLHVGGHKAPQIITEEIIDFVDFAITCSPYTSLSSTIRNLPDDIRSQKVAMAYGAADFDRLSSYRPIKHQGFNVGYIGTINFQKMHPDFVEMSAKVKNEDINFRVWGGGGAEKILLEQANHSTIKNRFFYHGYANNLADTLSIIDVFGYPLCEDTYAGSEIILQEVMYVGIVPIVFPYGGIQNLIVDNYTGLVVRNNSEYAEAIEYLYYNPLERERISNNAKEYAKQIFSPLKAAEVIYSAYNKLLTQNKTAKIWPTNFINNRNSNYNLTPETLNSGAAFFAGSVGSEAEPYIISLVDKNEDNKIKAEEEIMKVSSLMRIGGIETYKNFYPHDPYLNLWAGLTALANKEPHKAMRDITRAIELGLNSKRVVLYLAQAAKQSGYLEQASELFRAADTLN